MNKLKIQTELNQTSFVMDNLSTLFYEFKMAHIRVEAITAVKDENNETFICVCLKDLYPHKDIFETVLLLKQKGLHIAWDKLSNSEWDYQVLFRVAK